MHLEYCASGDVDTLLLGAQYFWPVARRPHQIAVGGPVLSTQKTGGAVTDAIAGGVAAAGLFRLHLQFQIHAATTDEFTVAPRIGPEFMAVEIQREAAFRDFYGAEFEAAR